MVIKFKEALAIILIIFILVMILFISSTKKEEQIIKAKIVRNNTNYYDVNTIINEFISKSSDKYKNNLLGMLDKKYINEKGVNKNNIFKYIDNLSDGVYTFDTDKMYCYNFSDNLVNYYVYGTIMRVSIDDEIKYKDKYYIVTIDNDKNIFSITPDDGTKFKEVTK